MRIGVPRETADGEARVALVPEVVGRLTGAGHQVLVERSAGEQALIPDSAYEASGATMVGPGDPFGAQLVVKVGAPSDEEIARLTPDTVLIGFLAPLNPGGTIPAIAASGATAFA